MQYQLINNKQQFRYELALPDSEPATATYRWLKGDMVLLSVVVPIAWRGKGIAGQLVAGLLEQLRSQGLKVIIYCPFAQKYVKKHPEYNDVLAVRN